MPTTAQALRTQWFDYLFGDSEGYVCIATATATKKDFSQSFFKWPEQRSDLSSFIDVARHRKNVWYCTSLLDRPERKKEFCLPGFIVWADLDACHPSSVSPSPSAVIESSPRRYQAIWRLDEIVEPYVQEDYSKRIAYKYALNGADPSGWDLTQLLRVPLTFNYKYVGDGSEEVPEVKLEHAAETKVPQELFKQIDRALGKEVSTADAEVSMPDIDSLPQVDWVIYRYYAQLNHNPAFKALYQTEPKEDEDWSRSLWRLLNVCLEVGMSDEEVFVVALNSKCNKYARDNRPPVHLWEDILRASIGQRRSAILLSQHESIKMPELVSESELTKTFIDDYKKYGEQATDAVPEFHELAAFILLSSVISSGVVLQASYGEMMPNLWGLVLGDSTLSRKTTAMRMAMDMLTEIDQDLILATDGSAEGLLTGLSARPNLVSIYYRDEVSGFFDSINRKDYLAGLPETLTQLYDVPKVYTRRLRKETITISSPVFIFFGGGIRDKVFTLIDDSYILSGFLPRFLIVSGNADLARIRRTGPSERTINEKRRALQSRIADLHEHYNEVAITKVMGQSMTIAVKNEAILTPDAWDRYGDIEEKMVAAAYDSSISMMALPTFERLSRSLLKMAILLAASETTPQENDGFVPVDAQHVINAAGYIQRWGQYTIELLLNSGKGTTERTLDKILANIEANPGMRRADLMRRYHLNSRETNDILNTLEERGQIMVSKQGRGVNLKAV